AWPVLKAYGCGATVFVVTEQIGKTNAWDREEIQEPLMSADEIRELRAEGVHFGSHSATHVRLGHADASDVVRELTTSRATLEGLLGERVWALSYPYNNQSPAVRGLARAAGYRVAVMGRGRMNTLRTDPLALRRVQVDHTDTLPRLLRRLKRLRATQWW